MAESKEAMEYGRRSVTDTFDESENLEDPEDDKTLETEEILNTLPVESVAKTDLIESLSATLEKLLLEIKNLDPDKQKEGIQQYIDSIHKVYDKWQDQVLHALQAMLLVVVLEPYSILADLKNQEVVHLLEIEKLKQESDIQINNLTTILNIQAEDLQREILDLNQIRQKLLDDLKNQEENHLIEIEKLKQQSDVEITNLTTIHNIQTEEFQKEILEKDQIRQKLLIDLKDQEESHLVEIENLKQQFHIEITNLTAVKNIQVDDFFMEAFDTDLAHQSLMAEFQNQEEMHLLKIEELKEESNREITNLKTIQNTQAENFQKELLEKDQKLLTDLKNQEEIHLLEIEKLKEDFKKEIEQYRQQHESNITCSICWDSWSLSGSHRLIALSCGHLYGESCIRESLERNEMCPQCRAIASVDDILRLYGPR